MKKTLAILFVYCALMLPSFATITGDEATSPEYLENHGYSQEMIRLIDLQHAQFDGQKSTYKKREPAYYSYFPVKWIRKAFIYLDCGLDDGKFMQHDIKYSQTNDL